MLIWMEERTLFQSVHNNEFHTNHYATFAVSSLLAAIFNAILCNEEKPGPRNLLRQEIQTEKLTLPLECISLALSLGCSCKIDKKYYHSFADNNLGFAFICIARTSFFHSVRYLE